MITSIKREFNLFPNIVGIVTTDNLATITTAGYFSTQESEVELLNNGVWQWENEDIVLIYYSSAQIGFFTYNASTDTFVSLAANGGLSNTLSSGFLFVGNASNVATGVALSGDATISNAGALTIATNAITTAKINAAAVTLAKLATGIAPSHIVKFGGTNSNGGGSATITITVTGMLSTDLPFVQIQASTNAVTVQKVTPTANTITVLLSGDPGAATTLSYQVLRAAS